MPIAALVGFVFRPDAAADAERIISALLQTTRTFAGLTRLDILSDPADDTRWTLYEIWDDEATEGVYRAFRATPEGGDADLAAALAEPPSLQRFVLHE